MLRSFTASARRLAAPLVVLSSLICAPAARALSTDRAGNLFASGEDIVLKTTATGTAAWLLTNDYGDRIEGRTPVVDGVLRIPTDGLRYGRYTFEVARDGKVVGGIVPPVIDLPPDLGTMVFAPFQEHWQNPEEALMWRQIGFWELRYEYGLSGFNPRQGQYVTTRTSSATSRRWPTTACG